eukprot:TRINITY_DN4493_c0_g1_i1.p1 TRINITY_DN4493_c0_g1~~TRINITY_DN4493_c0_g1_i1.p1  ORF type:complete len:369 (-),score=65.58 TRINITY_DN4493_c0_g1_i1:234-1253(-)
MAMEEDPHVEKRAKFLDESMKMANAEPRWGYFGIAGPLAIGDNSYAPRLTRKPKDDEEGDPIRNIMARPMLKGTHPNVYFSFAPPLGGEYFERIPKEKQWYVSEDAKFKPPGSVRGYESTNTLGYEYVPHCDNVKDPKEVREKYRDYQPLRQIYSNPTKKGGGGVLTRGVLFGMNEERDALPVHQADDYDAAKKMRYQDLLDHKAKLQETAFKPGDYGNAAFGGITDTYHYDIPTHIPRTPPSKEVKGAFPHEAAFKPGNPMKKGIAPVGGMSGLMGGVPEYVPEGPGKVATRKPKDDDAPPGFKVGAPRAVCNPMPSVTCNIRNMRNERPSSFARPIL